MLGRESHFIPSKGMRGTQDGCRRISQEMFEAIQRRGDKEVLWGDGRRKGWEEIRT